MFTSIHNIRDFGVFANYSGSGIAPFRAFNLIYGWNYSGKTTLSRIFRSIELGRLHADFGTSTFRIDCDDGTQVTQDLTISPIVRVFNEDFRYANFRWNEANSIEPILILGETNIANKDALDTAIKYRETVQTGLNEAETEQSEIQTTIAKAETECGNQISRELSIPRFDKRHVQKLVAGLNGTYPETLSADRFQAIKITALSTEKKELLPEIVVQLPKFSEWIELAKRILTKSVTSSKVIQHLLDHPDISQWVEHGRELHKSREKCEFCGNDLSSARIEELNSHFSKEFESLKNEISDLLSELAKADLKINGTLYVKTSFYSDFHQEWNTASGALKAAREAYNNSIQTMKDALSLKLSNPFETQFSTDFDDKTEALRQAIKDFNDLISRNNERSNAFQATKDAAIELLKRHYCADAMRKIDRFAKEKRLAEIAETVILKKEEKRKIDAEIVRLQVLLSEAAKGADRLNDTLERFFGKNDIQILVGENDKYVLMRGASIAKNLSEGEKTAICFAYFIIKLLENNNRLADTIVYIDDPISSLDSNHLMNVHAFIKDTFYKFDKAATPKHQCLAKQLFISTHNYEFFHLAWEWMSERTPSDFRSAYLIQRTDSNGMVRSEIIDCPDSIKKYRSEYLFLFLQIANYIENPNNDMQVIFNLGNMARRFIEGYFLFKYLNYTRIDDHINELISDTVKAERARKFMHFYSHSLKRAGGHKIPDMSEAKEVLELIFEAIRAQDPIHFSALQASR